MTYFLGDYVRKSLGLSKDITILISTLIADSSEVDIKKAEHFLKPMSEFADCISLGIQRKVKRFIC